jgi:hypothetical protein
MSVSAEPCAALDTGRGYQLVPDGPGRWLLSGEVDVAAGEQFAASLGVALTAAGAGRCVISLDELLFIDLGGLRAMALAAAAAGVRVELRGVPAVFWRYWYLAGFSEIVTGVHPVS